MAHHHTAYQFCEIPVIFLQLTAMRPKLSCARAQEEHIKSTMKSSIYFCLINKSPGAALPGAKG